jgi:hypothetical protein
VWVVVVAGGGEGGWAWVLRQRQGGLYDPMPLSRVGENDLELRQSGQAVTMGMIQTERVVVDTEN